MQNLFSIRTKQLMLEKHITQTELAKAVNITQATLSRNLSLTHRPKSELIESLADFFGVTTDYLLGKTDDRHSSTPQIALHKYEPDVSDQLSLDLHKAIDDLDHHQKERTLGYVNGLKQQG